MKSVKTWILGGLMLVVLTAFPGTASASPDVFTADQYPATLSGVQGGYFSGYTNISTEVGTYKCEAPPLSVEVPHAAEQITAPASNAGCFSFGSTLLANSCEFTFHPGESSKGTVDIGGAKCGGLSLGYLGCTIKIFPVSGLPATYKNLGTGSSARVEVEVQEAAIKEEMTTGCSQHKTYTGSWKGSWVLTSKKEGTAVGLHTHAFPGLSINAFNEFHSEIYPVMVNGEQTEGKVGEKTYSKLEFATVGGSVKCSTATFATYLGFFPEGYLYDAEFLAETPTLEGCTLAGLGATVTPEAGCFFEFGSAGPFTANLGLCGLEVKSSVTPCKLVFSPQARTGLEYANVGSGSSSKVEMKADVSGLTYQVIEGPKCSGKPASGTYNDGKFRGVASFKVTKVG